MIDDIHMKMAPDGAVIRDTRAEMIGETVYLASNGGRWFEHHLVDNVTPPLPERALVILRYEMAVADAWSAAKDATAAAERALSLSADIGAFTPQILRDTLRSAEGSAARAYSHAKRAAVRAIAAERG